MQAYLPLHRLKLVSAAKTLNKPQELATPQAATLLVSQRKNSLLRLLPRRSI